MRRLRLWWIGVLSVGAFLAPAADADAALKPSLVECGQPITASIRVANNLVDCPGKGLDVETDGITLDLGGHRLDGSGVGIGIDLTNRKGVVVRNGVVSDFQTGVESSSGAGNTITRIVAMNNPTGIYVAFDSKTTVSRNVVTDDLFGIDVTGGGHNRVLANDVVGSGTGIHLTNTQSNSIQRNRVRAGSGHGIELEDGANQNVLQSNSSTGNIKSGFHLKGPASGNQLISNRTTGNGDDGITLEIGANNNHIRDNTASANSSDGVVLLDSTANDVRSNRTHENGRHGIASNAVPNTITRNSAKGNGFLNESTGNDVGYGVSAPNTTAGSDNEVAANDHPLQCAPVGICVAGSAPPPVVHITCGQVVDTSIRVGNNIDGCAGNGLQVVGQNVSVNLNGHRIEGTGVANGAYIDPVATGATLSNGVLTRFEVGVDENGTDDTLSRLLLVANAYGLESSGDRFTVDRTAAVQNGTVAMNVLAAHATVKRSSAYANDAIVIIKVTGTANILNNVAIANGGDGFTVTGRATVRENRAIGNKNSGIWVTSPARVYSNVTRGNGQSGIIIVQAQGAVVHDNVASGNDQSGIHFGDNGSADSRATIRQNRAMENGLNGISVLLTAASSRAVIRDNVANRNGFLDGVGDDGGLGVYASGTGSFAGKSNSAHGNDNPSECIPEKLC